jgi:hypothetical protein
VPLVILVTAATVSLGVVGVQASTQCVRFIRDTVQRHHKVSAATAAKWKTWNKAHPNWHPKPTPKETLAQLNFACEVPMEQTTVAEELPPIELSPLVLPRELLAPPVVPTVVAENTPPETLFPQGPSDSLVSPPIYSPQYPALFGALPLPSVSTPPEVVQAAPTPEPAGWVLMATALAAGASFARRQRRQAKAA